jgi:hypothetical protein
MSDEGKKLFNEIFNRNKRQPGERSDIFGEISKTLSNG